MKQNRIFHIIVLAAIFLAGQVSASAASTFSVTSATSGTTTTFTVTRTGDTSAAETVLYRTVSLSAYAGFHFTAKSGSLDFAAGETSKTVNISESSSNVDAFKYQVGTTRTYRFEVTDWEGAILAYRDRSMTTGTSVASTAFGVKDMTINSGTITVTDAGYAQAYHSVTVADYYSAAAPKDYFAAVGAELRMTVSFDAREKDDGYQYVQIYANTTPNDANTDTGAEDGWPGSVAYARYAAGFSIDGNGASTYYSYTFPLTSYGHECGKITDAWSHGMADLIQQRFHTDCRATDGRLIIPTDLTSLYVRLNASGNNSDTWYCQNLAAHIQAVETTAPAKYGNGHMHVSGGRHVRGNTFYVALPFSEIVTVTGTPTITTSWGTASYMTGSGSNVLTFTGTIDAAVGTTLAVTALNGTVKDLAGNALTSFQSSYSTDAVEYIPWHGNGTSADPYIISSNADLDQLAARVNSDENFNNTYFLQTANIAYTSNCTWDYAGVSTLAANHNSTPIGGYGKPFKGTYDGGGHTISGIRMYRFDLGTSGHDNQSVGLFGFVSGGTVKNVVLRDANIFASQDFAGIVGYLSGGSVTGCTLYHVYVGTSRLSFYNQNIVVGNHASGTVSGNHYRDCIRRHVESGGENIERWNNVYTVTLADGVTATPATVESVTIDAVTYYAEGSTFTLACTVPTGYTLDGYTATNGGTVSNNIAVGANVNGNDNNGAIVGRNDGGTLAGNYYYDCTVGTTANATNAGTKDGDVTEKNGAVRASTYNFKPAEIGAQTAAYSGGITAYEYGLSYQGLYYMSNATPVSTAVLTLVQGTKDGVTAYWGTFYDGTHRYTLPAGAAAYTMDSEYKLYRLGTDGRTIPAGVAVVIIAASADVTLTLDSGSSAITDHAPGGNILHGSDSAVDTAGLSGNPHVLSLSGGVIGFRPFTGASIPAGKAYYVVTP